MRLSLKALEAEVLPGEAGEAPAPLTLAVASYTALPLPPPRRTPLEALIARFARMNAKLEEGVCRFRVSALQHLTCALKWLTGTEPEPLVQETRHRRRHRSGRGSSAAELARECEWVDESEILRMLSRFRIAADCKQLIAVAREAAKTSGAASVGRPDDTVAPTDHPTGGSPMDGPVDAVACEAFEASAVDAAESSSNGSDDSDSEPADEERRPGV